MSSHPDRVAARDIAEHTVRDAFIVPPAIRRARLRARCYYGAFGMTVFSLGLWFIGAVFEAREAARSSQCRANLKQIGFALVLYADKYGSYPPPFIADENGRPMHSWRTLILPYMDLAPLYARYRFDEPWDGPNNQKLHSTIIGLFNCPTRFPSESQSPTTSYLAVVGRGTLWQETGVVRAEDVEGGLGNTLMVVEVENSDVLWIEPRDLHVRQMAPTINPKAGQGISSPHYKRGGAHSVMADDSLKTLNNSRTPAEVNEMLTIEDDEIGIR
jgi:hypothetical protein